MIDRYRHTFETGFGKQLNCLDRIVMGQTVCVVAKFQMKFRSRKEWVQNALKELAAETRRLAADRRLS